MNIHDEKRKQTKSDEMGKWEKEKKKEE